MEQLKQNNKVILKGKIVSVEAPVKVGVNNLDKQTILFIKPPYNDGFEDQGKPQIWELSVIGKKVAELNITAATHEGKKATVVFYVDSNEVPSKEAGGKVMHIINATLVQVELYTGREGQA